MDSQASEAIVLDEVLAHEHPDFARAVKAVVTGSPRELSETLSVAPDLVEARSRSRHRATLLHYLTANAVEDDLQLSPLQIYQRMQICGQEEYSLLKAEVIQVAEVLLQAGVKVDALAEAYGGGVAQTPLNWLVSSEHPARAGVLPELTDLFCRYGANPDGLAEDSSPLLTAVGFSHPQAVQPLVEHSCKIDNLLLAAAAGDVEKVKAFHGPDGFSAGNVERCQLSWFQPPGETRQLAQLALVFASMCGHLDVIRYLVAAGVEIDGVPQGTFMPRSLMTGSALHTACLVGQEAVVDLLIELGSNPTVVDSRQQADAVAWAERGGHASIIKRVKKYLPCYLREREGTAPEIQDFVEAVRSGKVDQLQAVLTKHKLSELQINGPWFDFDAPAIVQARSNLEMVDCLLRAGADINRKSLWWAGGFGVLDEAPADLAERLIAMGATLDVWSAAGLGRLNALQQMVQADPNLVHARGPDGKTPLHCAKSVAVAAFLVSNGAQLDTKCIDHESTPLQYLVVDHPEVARYLIAKGCQADIMAAAVLGDADLASGILSANPEAIHTVVDKTYFPSAAADCIYSWKLGWYSTPHVVAHRFRHPGMVAFLMHHSEPITQLLNACLMEDRPQIAMLKSTHPGLSDQLSERETCHLSHAARNNQTEVVRLLLEHGWPVTAVGQHQATALHWAAFHGNAQMLISILEMGPALEVRDADFGSTPVEWAVEGVQRGWHMATGNYPAVIERLLEAGCKIPEDYQPIGHPKVDRLLASSLA